MSKRWISMSKGKEGSSLKKLAAGSLTFVKAYSNGQANSAIDSLEQELEAEIKRDTKTEPQEGCARLRHRGGKILRSKHVLMCIVMLNVIDCALVLGELILDLHHVKDILKHSEQTSSKFLEDLQEKYPNDFSGVSKLENIYAKIMRAHLTWNETGDTTVSPSVIMQSTGKYSTKIEELSKHHLRHKRKKKFSGIHSHSKHDSYIRNIRKGDNPHRRSKRSEVPETRIDVLQISDAEDGHSIEGIIAQSFHKTSLFIVCVLLVETSLKVICYGKSFFSHKLEVFDATIVVASFIVDFYFLKGLSVYSIQDFVFILAFMLPWGVIRVVNSLVVAVKDHEHFRLKLLYTQKKKIESDNKQIRLEKEKCIDQLEDLQRLCLQEGIEDWKLHQTLSKHCVKPGKGIMGSFASLAFGALSGNRSNGASIWSLLGTPKLRKGKSMEWEGKLGSKDDAKSLRYSERVWSIASPQDTKKCNQLRLLNQQSTVESDPGTSTPSLRGKLKQFKRFLKRQETVSSLSSNETLDKHSKCSLDKLTSSEASTPMMSFDETGNEENFICMERLNTGGSSTTCEIINESKEDNPDNSGDSQSEEEEKFIKEEAEEKTVSNGLVNLVAEVNNINGKIFSTITDPKLNSKDEIENAPVNT